MKTTNEILINGKAYRVESRSNATEYGETNVTIFDKETGESYGDACECMCDDMMIEQIVFNTEHASQFAWCTFIDEGSPKVMFRIGGGAMEYPLPLEEVEVVDDPDWGVSVIFHYDGGLFEENPKEYNEEAKEALRSLLRHLGYKRSKRWSHTLA